MKKGTILFLFIFLSITSIQAQSKEVKEKLKTGDKFYNQGDSQFENALVNFKSAISMDPSNSYALSKVANILFSQEKYEEAVPYFIQYIEQTGDKSSDEQYLLARSYQLSNQNDKAINAYKALIEASEQQTTNEISRKKIEIANLYISQCRNAKEMMKSEIPILMHLTGSKLNSPYPDYAPIGTNDMKTIYFTSRRPGSTGGKIDKTDKLPFEDIYVSTLNDNGEWSVPKQVPGQINTSSHEATVSLSSDGKRMIIYKPSKNGDLFESTFQNGEWSKPVELKGINSKYREVDATFSPDGNTIYFTSNNPTYSMNKSMDILVSKRMQNGNWSSPVNLGSEINTPYDELYVHLSPNGKTLYFSSEGHNSIGGFDIFKCTMQENGKWSKPINVGYPINSIGDDISMFFSPDGKTIWFDSDRKGGMGYRDIYEMIDLSDATKKVTIEVRDRITNKLLSAEALLIPVKSKLTDTINLKQNNNLKFEQNLGVFQTFQLNVSKKYYTPKSIQISTFFSSSDSITTPVNETVYLEPASELVVTTVIADKATQEIIKEGVLLEVWNNNQRVKQVQPLIDGSFEFPLKTAEKYMLIARKEGYTLIRDTFVVDTNSLHRNIEMDKIKVNQRFELKDIYFDFGKATLRPESEAELDQLKAFLIDNPSIIVEISAHTDNVGPAKANSTLSNNRANSVVSWLVEKGIPQSQMTAKGYGMSQPIAPNNTEENRQKNRRVEFKITQILKSN